MSEVDIQSWISSSGLEIEDEDQEIVWQRDRVLNEWPRALEYAQRVLLNGKTKSRIGFLRTEIMSLAKHSDLSLSQILDLFKLLTLTYPIYIDSGSRDAVELIGMELVRRDSIRGTAHGHEGEVKLGVAEHIFGWLSNEVGSITKKINAGSHAPSDLFVLLSWTCGLYSTCVKSDPDFVESNSWRVVIGLMALLLDTLLMSTNAKPSLKHGGLVRTRRSLRSDGSQVAKVINTVLGLMKPHPTPSKLLTLLDVAVSVLIRLKNSLEDPVQRLPQDSKIGIIGVYTTHVVMSKAPIPERGLTILGDFISTYITNDDLEQLILPTLEKALLRAPEVSLPVVTQFFLAFRHSLDPNIFQRLVGQVVSSSKSSNPTVRTDSIQLFKALLTLGNPEQPQRFSQVAISELLSLPKAGKSAGPDHRIALYSMLALVTPGEGLSATLLQATAPLLSKETSEGATAVLAAALPRHIVFLLEYSTLPAEISQLIAKEIVNTKPAIRNAFVCLAGSIFFDTDVLATEQGLAFAETLLPSLESTLTTFSSNPAHGGPCEGYVAIAVLLGSFTKSKKFDAIVRQNPAVTSVSTVGARQSFLLWDKVYQKVTAEDEEQWLLRAVESSMLFFSEELLKNEQLRIQFGLLFIHLALNSQSTEIRKSVNALVCRATLHHPKLTNLIMRESLTTFLIRAPLIQQPTSGATDDTASQWNKHTRLAALLLSAVSFAEEVESSMREESVVELIVLVHHHLICRSDRQSWIDLCQKGGLDPREVIENHLDRLFEIVLENSLKPEFAQASYTALTTLVFVAPALVSPRLLSQLKSDINVTVLNNVSDLDLGVWATPEGTTFVDVVSSVKDTRPSKGRDHEIAKWEDNVRKSLAAKNAGPPKLTKQQEALIKAQLEQEAKIRQTVKGIRDNLIHGLHFIQSMVAANIQELQSYVTELSSLLLGSALSRGSTLANTTVYETYLDLAKCASDRLGHLKQWAGIATLRCLRNVFIPEEFQAEPLQLLVLRILYRLRFLSDQAPLDAATFSYVFPLFSHVLRTGGIPGEGEEDPEVQVALVVEIFKLHSPEFSSSDFPRKSSILDLIHVIKHQAKLRKEASSALVGLGESVSTNITSAERDAFLEGTLSQESHARSSCLQAIQPLDFTDLDWSPQLWIACYDEDEQNARLASRAWDENGLDVPETYLQSLPAFLGHDNEYVRSSTARGIAGAVEQYPQTMKETIPILQNCYREKAKILAPEFDEYGMVIAETVDRSDPWPTRLAVAQAFTCLASFFTDEQLETFFTFLINDKALGDAEPAVRKEMLCAGNSIIDLRGANRLAALMKLFERHLAESSSSSEADDFLNEAVVILFGRLAHHLEASDSRIPNVVDRLVDALKTPSEQVQIAVAECLSPLVPFIQPRLPGLADNLFKELSDSPKYASRRGAAYGLAGVINGTGIRGMKCYNVMARLKAASEEKKRYEPRQGVMFAFETLSRTLGRLFEPYITFVLPLLLSSFGDANPDVREATQDASRIIMGNLSGYGVKLILPTLLEGLDEKQWRSKKGSIELLGMMAYCSPRQLSISLPIVIPRLTGVLTDSHTQVRTAANKSLKQFGEVISNPEIKALTPVLLKALVDPGKTINALSSLLKTAFTHYIDNSSLALVIPIIERGLRERGADIKKKAVQIVGNLASLTDSKDFVPYLNNLLPLVHQVLVDPVPEARATAAKTMGALVERMGEIHFPDLVPSLLRTLKTDTSGVDRQGAAQGLSEVLAGLGMERLEGLLPDILANAQSPRPTVREGFMSLLVYLPATFGTRFQPHLPKIIAPILGGISDTEEYVREAAMRAGRMVIANYSNKAIDLLLPELENGMFDPGWRIRQSSVTLVGELLFKVSGISGKTSEVEEEEAVQEPTTADSFRRILLEVLGSTRRDRILAALYLLRQDGVVVVRQTSIQIWKALVHNTPRTVREILPELINKILVLISSDEDGHEEIAGRTIGELCRKFGERILGEIMPILKGKSTSTDPRARQGVALAIGNLMQYASDGQREEHEHDIIVIVRISLVDDEAIVRVAAAQAFDVLQEELGAKAIDETIPTLLQALRQPGKSSATALQALKEVMSVRATTVFPVLIPTLTAIPMTVFNARALASLVTVAGNALSRRLTVILKSLVKVLESDIDDELRSAVNEALHALLSSIGDPEGLNTLMLLLLGWVKHDSPARRVSACKLYTMFCEVSSLDSSAYRVDWIRQLVSLLDDGEIPVHTAAWETINRFVGSLPKDELEPLVIPLRRTIESTGAPGRTVPGLNLPKGVSPLVPMIIAGLTTGNNEQREQAAYAIGDLVARMDESAIKPYVVPFTGPLIRVATQAMSYPPGVKMGILSALSTMLERVPTFVKPFFPQLQRTFVKSLSDPSSGAVRKKAAEALGILMKNQPRVDPVVTELITGARGSEDLIGASYVQALACVLKNTSQNIGDKARESCIELVSDAFREACSESYSEAVASLFRSLSDKPELLKSIVESHLVVGTPATLLSSQIVLAVVSNEGDEEEEGPNLFQALKVMRTVAQKVLEGAASDKPFVARRSREARDIIKNYSDDTLGGLF